MQEGEEAGHDAPPERGRRPLKYRRIAEDLRDGIRRGEYEPGRPLPGENDLMARYRVARMTVRQALAELQREGLAVARRGSGVYVSDFRPIVRDELHWLASMPWARGESVWHDAEQGGDLTVQELGVVQEGAPEHVATALQIEIGQPVWARTRRFVLDRREVMLSVSWVSREVAAGSRPPDPGSGPAGVYAWLTEAGHPPTRFREDVRARLATPHEAERLALSAGSPVIAVRRIAYAGPSPVEVTEAVLDATVYVLRYEFPATAP